VSTRENENEMERKQQRKKRKEQMGYYLNKLDRWKDTKTKTYAISRQRKQYLTR